MTANGEWRPKGRPTSTLVLNFEADLDDIFNLGSQADLALSVEAKKNELKTRERQLEDLDAKLRQADEQLKSLQNKHKRIQSEQILTRGSNRYPTSRGNFNNSSDSEERGFSDA